MLDILHLYTIYTSIHIARKTVYFSHEMEYKSYNVDNLFNKFCIKFGIYEHQINIFKLQKILGTIQNILTEGVHKKKRLVLNIYFRLCNLSLNV